MYIINAKGELVEGQELTAEEVRLIPNLVEGLQEASTAYLREDDAKKMVRHIIETYCITARKQPTPEPIKVEPPPAPTAVFVTTPDDDLEV